MNAKKGQGGGIVISVVLGLASLICGLIIFFVVAPQQQSQLAQLNSIAYLTADELATMPAGKEVLFTGVFDGNDEMEHDFIVYERYEWEVDPWDEKDPVWHYLNETAPALQVIYQGQTVMIDGAATVPLGGMVSEAVDQGMTSADGADYNGEYLYDGAIRFRGFRDGDTVTVQGVKTASGSISPTLFYLGTREDLIASTGDTTNMSRTMGVTFMVCSPIIAGLGIAFYLFKRR